MEVTFNGREIKRVLKAKKIKVKDLAETIGLTPNTLSSALNGKRNLSLAVKKSIFRELNLNAKSLVKDAA